MPNRGNRTEQGASYEDPIFAEPTLPMTFVRDKETPEDGQVMFTSLPYGELLLTVAAWERLGCPDIIGPVEMRPYRG